jgi:hypothetical protein
MNSNELRKNCAKFIYDDANIKKLALLQYTYSIISIRRTSISSTYQHTTIEGTTKNKRQRRTNVNENGNENDNDNAKYCSIIIIMSSCSDEKY